MWVMSRNSTSETVHKGCHLLRHFLSTDSEDETVAATLTGNPACISTPGLGLPAALEHRYGLPEFERFSADGNVDVGVLYRQDRTVAEVDLNPRKHLPIGTPDTLIFNVWVVESLINSFAPPDTLLNPKRRVNRVGAKSEELLICDNFRLLRAYQDGALTHASIAWK